MLQMTQTTSVACVADEHNENNELNLKQPLLIKTNVIEQFKMI